MSRDPFGGRGDDGGFGPDDGRGWHEPEHLGQGAPSGPPSPDPAAAQPPSAENVPAEEWGARRAGDRRASEASQVFAYQGDEVGAQGWALQHGWTPSDGTGPQDAVLAELVASAPVRPTRDHHPAGVLRGRFGALELVAFDIVYASGRYLVPQWAVTAAPLLVPVPTFRLSPARFWKHRVGGLLHVPSGDAEFDARWMLLTAEDSPAVRSLVADAQVRELLLGSDDGDEFWSAVGHVAAIRPDGHRPALLEHHGRLLTAIVGALMATA